MRVKGGAPASGRRFDGMVRHSTMHERLVSLQMSPLQLGRRAFFRTDPGRIPYFSATASRFPRLDFSKANLPRQIDVTLRDIESRGGPPGEARVASIVARIGATADAIRGRGGEVVLVHMPHDGAVRSRELELHPRERYWDRIIDATGLAAIHFADRPSLKGFRCPDGSHIDRADTDRFTAALTAEIRDELVRWGAPAPWVDP